MQSHLKSLTAVLTVLVSLLACSFVSAEGLAVRIFPDKARVAAGESMLWNVIVTNASDSVSPNTKLRITLPDKINGVEPRFFNYEPDTETFYYYGAGEVVSYDLGNLPAGYSFPIKVTMWADDSAVAGTPFTMDAQVESDTDFVDSSATVYLASHPTSIQITSPGVRAVNGQSLEYSVGYSYQGTSPLELAGLAISVPPGFAVESATAGCKVTGSVLSWNLGTLLKGDNGARWFSLKYTGTSKPGTFLDVTADIKAGATTLNRARWTMVASSGAGLTCRAYAAKRQVEPGQSISWTVEVSNQSPYPVTGGRLLVDLPTDMYGIEPKYFSPAPTTDVFFSYDPGQRVHYLIGDMAPGARKVFQIRTYPLDDAPQGGLFLLSANTDSSNGIWGGSSQAAVAFGPYVPMVPDIRIESPVLVAITDNQKTPISFGSRKVGKTYNRSFTIRNLGPLDLAVSKIMISGTNAADWTYGSLTDWECSMRESATLTVRFKPRGKGTRNAVMSVYSNDPDESPYEVRLTGKGT